MLRGLRARSCGALAGLLALAACAAPAPERYLRLDAVAGALNRPGRPPLSGDLQLLPFTARGLLTDPHVVYIEPDGAARPSASLIWEEVPAVAAPRVIARVLQAAWVANAVLPPDSSGLAGFWLEGAVERFELAGPGDAAAVVQIELTLKAGSMRRPALVARYCRSVPAAANPAEAFARALSQIGVALAADLAAHAAALNGAGDKATPAILIGQQIGGAGGACGGDA